MAKRTKSGDVSAAARKKHGAKSGSGLKKGSFPVFDVKSAKAALRLRGHAPSKKKVVDKVAAYANKTGNKSLKFAVQRARMVDKRKK